MPRRGNVAIVHLRLGVVALVALPLLLACSAVGTATAPGATPASAAAASPSPTASTGAASPVMPSPTAPATPTAPTPTVAARASGSPANATPLATTGVPSSRPVTPGTTATVRRSQPTNPPSAADYRYSLVLLTNDLAPLLTAVIEGCDPVGCAKLYAAAEDRYEQSYLGFFVIGPEPPVGCEGLDAAAGAVFRDGYLALLGGPTYTSAGTIDVAATKARAAYALDRLAEARRLASDESGTCR